MLTNNFGRMMLENENLIKPIKILIVEEDLEFASMLQILFETKVDLFEPTHVDSIENAIDHLRQGKTDIILMDLSQAGNDGLEAFLEIHAQAPEIPIVVLSDIDDQNLAIMAIRRGAQDYLLKGELEPDLLMRALSFAIERQRMLLVLQQLSLNDDLTNLLNRRGFLALANQQIKIAQRADWESMLMFADLDGLKDINDNYGHPEGDRALRAAANILKETFRASDLIARLGGDEFVVLAINFSNSGIKTITKRLQENIERYNVQNKLYDLSMSFGVARFNSQNKLSLEELIAQADEALYAHKRNKQD
jgi:two-component system, cell cycle response regulator